jgi:DNA-binding MarR family transcriptional regulator
MNRVSNSRIMQIESARDEIKQAMLHLEMLLNVPTPATEAAVFDERQIRAIRRARGLRRNHFSAGLFADPAWDMLLDLYEAELGQRKIAITALGLGADIPATTALRWINTLLDEGLVERSNDPLDGRRVFISLSAKGLESMQSYFAVTAPILAL